MARVCPLFSGSSGNSYYIGSKKAGVLVDVGRTAKQIDNMLNACDIEPTAIKGILITHEHSDHVKGLRVFAKRHSLPVFATAGTFGAISDNLDGIKTYILGGELDIADMKVNYFHTSHDAAEPVGYRIKTADDRIVTVSTDTGYISEEIENSILGADFAIIESNHDVEMLRNNRTYPYILKQRIFSNTGHLSNDTCAGILPRMAKSGTTRFLLAHLSRDNNSRQIAVKTALAALIKSGFVENTDFMVDAARPENLENKVIVF